MNFSVVIPYYNNIDLIAESVNPLLDNPLVNDIVITHDCSDDYSQILDTFDHPKVRIYKNVKNWHILHNKRNAIYHAKNNWVVCLDSDNVLDENYLDVINGYTMDKRVIYAPEYAKPQFDYRAYSDKLLSKDTINEFAQVSCFQCFLNTFNYCVNRNEYLRVYEYTKDCHSADSIYFNYLWLKAGNSIYVVPELQYQHRVHKESTFLKEYKQSLNMADYYLTKIKEL